MANHDTIKQEVREEFDAKFKPSSNCQRHWSDDFSLPCTCDRDEANEAQIYARVWSFLEGTMDRVQEVTIQECVEALNDGLVVIDQKTVERFAHQLSMLPDGDFLKSDGAYFLRTAQLLTREREEAHTALLALKSNEV